nr:unnamed protein product [Spirometra erinaceieuropaei]
MNTWKDDPNGSQIGQSAPVPAAPSQATQKDTSEPSATEPLSRSDATGLQRTRLIALISTCAAGERGRLHTCDTLRCLPTVPIGGYQSKHETGEANSRSVL